MSKIVDLTRTLENRPDDFPAMFKPLERILFPKINYIDHKAGAAIMMQIFNCQKSDLPKESGWAEEDLTISSHLGTHVDAPWHYGPIDDTTKYPFIDQVPLENLYLKGCVLDFTNLSGTGSLITVDMLQEKLDEIGLTHLNEPMAILLNTGSSEIPIVDFKHHNYPGLDKDSADYLVKTGFTIIGTDATGIDRPFLHMANDFHKTNDKRHIWGAHFALQGKDVYILQQLTNLKALPVKNFKLACFPLKLKQASSAPARIVAFLD